MIIYAFDVKYKNRPKKSKLYREKEKNFEKLVWDLCDVAKEYNFNIWEGRTRNPFSIVLSGFIRRECFLKISIKLSNNEYLCCFTNEDNPNNIQVKDYNINLGADRKGVVEFVRNQADNFCKENGKPKMQEYVFTINPIFHLREEK